MKDILKNSIESHYENKDYTEVVRDALLCLLTEIRKKSDLTDSDGVDLINKAFSESKSLIKINKLATSTEKNKQKGIMDLSKGLIEYFRNPMSHSKQEYSKKVADAILILLDEVILEEIVKSKSKNSLEDWYLEIANELSPNTERYAEDLIIDIPDNKYYELLMMLYKSKNDIYKIKNRIIDKLIDALKEEDFKEYCEIIEYDLFGNISEQELIHSLNFISKNVWNNLSKLARTKIEETALEDISKIRIDCINEYDDYFPSEQKCGRILENSLHILENFSNLEKIIDIIVEKIVMDSNEFLQEYLFEKYFELIVNNSIQIHYDLIIMINEEMKYRDIPHWYDTVKSVIESLPDSNIWYVECRHCLKIEKVEDGLPF